MTKDKSNVLQFRRTTSLPAASQEELSDDALLSKLLDVSQNQAELLNEYVTKRIRLSTNRTQLGADFDSIRRVYAEGIAVEDEKNSVTIYVPVYKVLEVCGSMGFLIGVGGLLSWLFLPITLLHPVVCIFLMAASPFYYWMGRHIRNSRDADNESNDY